MAWPSNVTGGQGALASDFNGLIAALQVWGGDVSSSNYSLLDTAGVGLRTANASWQEFRLQAVAGGTQSADLLALQWNARSSAGGSDSWGNVFSLSPAGALTISSAAAWNGAVTLGAGLNLNGQVISGVAAFSGALAFNGPLTLGAGLNLNAQTLTGAATFSGSLTFTGTAQIIGAGQAAASGFSTISGLSGSLLVVDTGTGVLNGGSVVFGAAAGTWRFAALKGVATNGGGNSQGAISVLVRTNAVDATLTESVRFRDDGGVTFNYPENLSFGGGWQNWSPTVSGAGSLNISLNGGTTQYVRIGPLVYWYIAYAITVNSGTGNSIIFSVPVTNNSGNAVGFSGVVNSPSAAIATAGGYVNGQQIGIFLPNAPNLPTGSYTFFVSGFYRSA